MERDPASPARRRVVPNAVRIPTNNMMLAGLLFYVVCLRRRQITMDKQVKTVEFLMFLVLLTYTELSTLGH
jgi:hypothetical protein